MADARKKTAVRSSGALARWGSLPAPQPRSFAISPARQNLFEANADTENIGDSRDVFKGQGRVAQVLRWVSSAALSQSRGGPNDARNLVEVQSSVIGGKLVMGSNAKDDDYVIGDLRTVLNGAPTKAINAGAQPDTNEAHRVKSQRHRHAAQLREFVNNNDFFEAFRDKALFENEGSADHGIQTVKMLETLRASLADVQAQGAASNLAEMAPGGPNSKVKHAEQRIIDHVQANRDTFLADSRQARYGAPDRDKTIHMVVAGTKPPCELCHQTEARRTDLINSVANAQPSGFDLVRYESMRGSLFPAGNSRKARPSDHHLISATVRAGVLDDDTVGTGVTLTHGATPNQIARVRRDSFSESIGGTDLGVAMPQIAPLIPNVQQPQRPRARSFDGSAQVQAVAPMQAQRQRARSFNAGRGGNGQLPNLPPNPVPAPQRQRARSFSGPAQQQPVAAPAQQQRRRAQSFDAARRQQNPVQQAAPQNPLPPPMQNLGQPQAPAPQRQRAQSFSGPAQQQPVAAPVQQQRQRAQSFDAGAGGLAPLVLPNPGQAQAPQLAQPNPPPVQNPVQQNPAPAPRPRAGSFSGPARQPVAAPAQQRARAHSFSAGVNNGGQQ